MDTALELRIKKEQYGSVANFEKYLEDSKLVRRLIKTFPPTPSYGIWRIIALSEIPYTDTLDYTQKLIQYLEDSLGTGIGFSFNGKPEGILPCYNGMLIEAFIKLGYGNHPTVQKGLEWILNYQPFSRNCLSTWSGKGVEKYGGCFKKTPCYIGLAKSLKALTWYSLKHCQKQPTLEQRIAEGTEYILNHKLYQRLSNGQPINKHILDLSFPSSYQLNIVELLEIVHLRKKIIDPRCTDAIKYLKKKNKEKGFYSINHIYSGKGYLSFDRKNASSPWLNYLLGTFLES